MQKHLPEAVYAGGGLVADPELDKAAAVGAGHAAYEPGTGRADFEPLRNQLVAGIIRHRLFGSHFGHQLRCHIH